MHSRLPGVQLMLVWYLTCLRTVQLCSRTDWSRCPRPPVLQRLATDGAAVGGGVPAEPASSFKSFSVCSGTAGLDVRPFDSGRQTPSFMQGDFETQVCCGTGTVLDSLHTSCMHAHTCSMPCRWRWRCCQCRRPRPHTPGWAAAAGEVAWEAAAAVAVAGEAAATGEAAGAQVRVPTMHRSSMHPLPRSQAVVMAAALLAAGSPGLAGGHRHVPSH